MFRQFSSRLLQAAGRVCVASHGNVDVVSKRFLMSLSSTTSASICSSTLAALALGTLCTASVMTREVLALTPRERSFIMVKPDGVHRGLVGEIIKRFEAKGYKLVGIKVLVPSKDLASKHYAEHDGRPYFPKLVNFISSGAVVAMVWEGKEVIKYGRTMMGVTNPLASAPGTVRGDFAVDVGRNILHGSDCVEAAQREIALWFSPEEIAEYMPALESWIYE